MMVNSALIPALLWLPPRETSDYKNTPEFFIQIVTLWMIGKEALRVLNGTLLL